MNMTMYLNVLNLLQLACMAYNIKYGVHTDFYFDKTLANLPDKFAKFYFGN